MFAADGPQGQFLQRPGAVGELSRRPKESGASRVIALADELKSERWPLYNGIPAKSDIATRRSAERAEADVLRLGPGPPL